MSRKGWTEEHIAAYNARRARACAVADGYRTVGDGRTDLRAGDWLQPYEREILSAVLCALELHPRVAFFWRQNTGGARYGPSFVRFAFPGCSDIIGMLRGGRLLAVECKRPGEVPTADQAAFLAAVNEDGGLGFVARSIDDVLRELG